MVKYLLWMVGFSGLAASAAIVYLHTTYPAELPAITVNHSSKSKVLSLATASFPNEQAVSQIWNRELRRPLYDPPPPPPPAPPLPPPTIPIAVLGILGESDRPFALLRIGNVNSGLMGVGDKTNSSGIEVEILSIIEREVRLKVGGREITARKEPQ
ncbi:hypothetical protein K2Y11_15195 [bacterium]|nr:hypothetical protein [bacterium]